jgi:MSHA pilin protein MshC
MFLRRPLFPARMCTAVGFWRRRPFGRKAAGFSLVELVVIVILVGILAVVAIPRLVGISTYNTVGFADRIQASLRYAQKQAIAKRRNVCAAITATTITFTYAATAGSGVGCTLAMAGPDGKGPFVVIVERGNVGTVTIASSSASISFDALGRVYDYTGPATFTLRTTAVVLTVTGDGSVVIRVEPETGYVHI